MFLSAYVLLMMWNFSPFLKERSSSVRASYSYRAMKRVTPPPAFMFTPDAHTYVHRHKHTKGVGFEFSSYCLTECVNVTFMILIL